jgi:predicted DsbA family dithiol-disulfide isomerase
VAIELRYHTDPVCTWSWATEPKLRRLIWEFADSLRIEWVMGGLARRYGAGYRDEEGQIGSGGDCFANLMAHWLDVSAHTGMPCDPRIWTEAPLASTYPVCQAVKAAAEQGRDAACRYLRRVREGVMVERRKLDHAAALVGEAAGAGLDVERFRIDLSSDAITEAFAADLAEVRRVPDAARRAGKVRRTEGRERTSFPSAVFIGEDGSSHGVWGWQPYEAYRKAAIAAGAQPERSREPEPLEALEHFGRATTLELEVLSGVPRPVLLAELWSAAKDWRVRPIAVLTGTIWEAA